MQQSNRREFLQQSLALGVAAAIPGTAWPAQVRRASDVIELGSAKLKVSRMAIGTGTFGGGRNSNQMRKLGADGLADLFSYAFDRGVFFWDTADTYGSHDAVKVALKRIPREKVVVSTKTSANTAEKMKADLDRFRQEMGTDYIDIVLLHARMSPKWDELDKPAMEVLSEAKEKKLVRTVGISVHSIDAMKVAAASTWLEVCLTRLNPYGVRMEGPTETMLPHIAEMKAAGKGLIAMKVFGEGQLVDRRDECLRFAVTKDAVHCFTIGCESIADFQDNFDRIAKVSQPA